MHAIKKETLEYFTPSPKSVCAIQDGSTNQYFENERVVEEFLETIEPNYNDAVNALLAENPDGQAIYTIAGFISYVSTCSPTAMRLHGSMVKEIVEITAKSIDRQGAIETPPESLGGKSLTDLINSGTVNIKIDKKYPQAIGIEQIINQTTMLGNFIWEILINPFEDSPFFTSDYPTVFEKTADIRFCNRVVPLATNIAVRIRPNLYLQREKVDISFEHFRYRTIKLERKQVSAINKLIVQSAENLVFFSENNQWVNGFIKKNANFYIKPKIHRVPNEKGNLICFTQEISKRE